MFLLFVTLLPALLGRFLLMKNDGKPYILLSRWCAGFVLMAALAWIPAVTGIFLHFSLTRFICIYLVLLLLPAAFSAAEEVRDLRASSIRGVRDISAALQALHVIRSFSLSELAAFVLPAAHAVVTFFMMYVDDDDVAYVGAVTTAVDTNTLMRYDAVNGNLITDFAVNEMNRLVTAPEFAFYAAISKLFRIRPAVLCHTFMPPVLTMLFYSSFFLAGLEMTDGDRKRAGTFTILVFLINMSSYFSVYTAGTFLMIRSWQGKAQIVGLILPLLFALFFRILRRDSVCVKDTGFLAALLGAACLMTSMGAAFACAAALVLGLLTAVLRRDIRVFASLLPAYVLPAAMFIIYFCVV